MSDGPEDKLAGGSSPASALDPAVEERLAAISAGASVEPWAADEVRKLVEPGEMPQQMLMCAGGLKSMVETGSLAASLQSMLGEDTVLVATDRRVAWVNPSHRESGSGSIPLREVRKVGLPRVFFFGKGQLTLELNSGAQVPFGISRKWRSHAKALAKGVAERRQAG